MNKTWIIAEHLKDNTFRVAKVTSSVEEPTEEFRKAVIEIFESYGDEKIPNTTACIFMPFDKEGSDRLARTGPDRIDAVFESLRKSCRTGCNDIVSIQRSAWCYIRDRDVLEYSYQNGGGSGSKRLAIVNDADFQAFREKRCEM